MGKVEKCLLSAYTLFPRIFPKVFFFKGLSVGWLVVLGFNVTLTANVISWLSMMHMFPGFLTPVILIPKPPTTFLTGFCRGERPKYAGKKSLLYCGSNSQPPGHESDTLTTEPHGWGGLSGSGLCCKGSNYLLQEQGSIIIKSQCKNKTYQTEANKHWH